MSDRELRQVKCCSGTYTLSMLAVMYGLILNRKVSTEEAQDALDRIYALHG